jgi:sugar lactone lactonase YvrE
MRNLKYLLITTSLFTFLSISSFAQKKSNLIEVASFGNNQPIGVTVAPERNRLFVSFPHHEPFLYGLTEIVNGKRVAYPDITWNKYLPDQPGNHFVNVQDLYADDKNYLWVLDSSPAGDASVFGKDKSSSNAEGKFKLLKINLSTNKVDRIYDFKDVDKSKSALNDVCIDNIRQLAYLSDPGLHAIVILDLKNGKSRIVLQDDKSTVVQPDLKLHIDGKDVVDVHGKPFISNVNGIALTKDNKYFYFRAINQYNVYRIKTDFLSDDSLSATELSSKVELVANTGICHGMIADKKGNIYLSNSPEHAIQFLTPNGILKRLVKDERLIWPDSFGIGSDGFLYLSSSQMHRLPKYNDGKDKVEYPYRVYKVKLPD